MKRYQNKFLPKLLFWWSKFSNTLQGKTQCKRRIIVTLAESRIGKILPMHFLYKDTANRLLAAVTFVADFALIYKEKDSSNEKEI